MDSTLQQAALAVLVDTAERGGGTYERGTLLPFRPNSGYAVGIGGIKLPASDATAESIVWALKAVGGEYETSYVGTWLDSGTVYFDAVKYFGEGEEVRAIACARFYGQAAIYDFALGEAVLIEEVPA